MAYGSRNPRAAIHEIPNICYRPIRELPQSTRENVICRVLRLADCGNLRIEAAPQKAMMCRNLSAFIRSRKKTRILKLLYQVNEQDKYGPGLFMFQDGVIREVKIERQNLSSKLRD